jgi:hypothetical protein
LETALEGTSMATPKYRGDAIIQNHFMWYQQDIGFQHHDEGTSL